MVPNFADTYLWYSMEINNKYGYVRISSKSQESNSSIESQKQELIQNGIEEENIFVEVGSGANEIKNRPVFQKLINQKLKENDLLIVTKIDKFSQNTIEFLKLQDILKEKYYFCCFRFTNFSRFS